MLSRRHRNLALTFRSKYLQFSENENEILKHYTALTRRENIKVVRSRRRGDVEVNVELLSDIISIFGMNQVVDGLVEYIGLK